MVSVHFTVSRLIYTDWPNPFDRLPFYLLTIWFYSFHLATIWTHDHFTDFWFMYLTDCPFHRRGYFTTWPFRRFSIWPTGHFTDWDELTCVSPFRRFPISPTGHLIDWIFDRLAVSPSSTIERLTISTTSTFMTHREAPLWRDDVYFIFTYRLATPVWKESRFWLDCKTVIQVF